VDALHEGVPFMEKGIQHEFRIKRVYDEHSADDGFRFLVDRLWPRGMKMGELDTAGWLKEVAPSPSLRVWFWHEEAKWHKFRQYYRAELAANPDAWAPLMEAIKSNNVTLLYAARNRRINHAVVLRDFLIGKTNTTK